MAVINHGTKVSIPTSLIPDDFVYPSVAEFEDQEYKRSINIEVDKATVENVDKKTTLLNILNDAAIGVVKQILDIVTADYIVANNVEYFIDVKNVLNNVRPSKENDFYNNVAVKFIVVVDIYIKTS